jgi:predicted restriction endonuclease
MKRTIADVKATAKYQLTAQIRSRARYVYSRSHLPEVCFICGYDKHVEICHVRAINDFPNDTPVAIVNDLANLVALCPNCHWEFDNGLLTL